MIFHKIIRGFLSVVQPQAQPVELRDTLVPSFLCKITPAGSKVFMLQYRTNAGERRKPALGLADETQLGSWAIHADAEKTLRALGERADIIRTMQRA